MGISRRQLICGTAASLVPSGAFAGDASEALLTGDLIFHTSRSGQSAAIMWATKSLLSHCGLVRVFRGQQYVIEAAGPVRVTPLNTWIKRGRLGRYLVMRHPGLSDHERQRVWREAKRYKGRPYDSLFLFGNRAIYCSELVWLAYQAVDVELGKVQTAGELDVDNVVVDQVLKRRWRKHPVCKGKRSIEHCRDTLLAQPMITPEAVADDPALVEVQSNYPLGLR